MTSNVPEPIDPRQLRVSDSERDQVAERLREAAGEGRLGLDELEDRITAVYTAKTYAELEPITRDLPVAGARPTARRIWSGSWRYFLRLLPVALVAVFLLPAFVIFVVLRVLFRLSPAGNFHGYVLRVELAFVAMSFLLDLFLTFVMPAYVSPVGPVVVPTNRSLGRFGPGPLDTGISNAG